MTTPNNHKNRLRAIECPNEHLGYEETPNYNKNDSSFDRNSIVAIVDGKRTKSRLDLEIEKNPDMKQIKEATYFAYKVMLVTIPIFIGMYVYQAMLGELDIMTHITRLSSIYLNIGSLLAVRHSLIHAKFEPRYLLLWWKVLYEKHK